VPESGSSPNPTFQCPAFLNSTGHWALAVSGGPDSLALAHLAQEYARQYDLTLSALTVDHHLRPESTDEALQVAEWMRTLGIPHHILTWTAADRQSGNLQEKARKARYHLLLEWCRAHKVPVLLLGHQQDDQAETFLMRLGRGSGVAGLSGMPEVRQEQGVWLVRPLLHIPKSQLKETLRQRGQPWLEDPGNHDPRFTRARVRALQPVLEEAGIPPHRIAEAAAHLGRARQALEFYRDRHLHACVEPQPGSWVETSLRDFQDAPEEIVLQSLAWLLRRLGGQRHPLRFDGVERVRQRLGDPSRWTLTLGGCVVEKTALGRLRLFREASACPMMPVIGAEWEWDGRFQLTAPPDVLRRFAEDNREKETTFPVIPAQAGIQLPVHNQCSSWEHRLDSRLRGNDGERHLAKMPVSSEIICGALGATDYPSHARHLPPHWLFRAKLSLPTLRDKDKILAIYGHDEIPLEGELLPLLPEKTAKPWWQPDQEPLY
jgi:tRNA(Ile)-lysidine synthase